MDAFAFRQPKRAERALKEVLAWMARSRLAPMIRAARTVRRHFDGVINAIISGITNATAEAINSRIQWIKKTGRGLSQPGAVPPGHLLPPRKPGPVPG